ncbi:MAG TPA: restriction endonuclease subunit S, partial [Acidobacteriota bacterium]|nr:restriction endonuclease subunit S [Acidobacteriota bacterium]
MSFPRYESYKDSGIEWLGEVPGHWEVRRLKKVVTLQRGHDLPGEIREEGDIPIISSGGYFGTHNQAQAKAPGIVTGRYGTIGEFIFVEQDYWPLNTTLYSIKMFSNVPRFVWYLLQSISEHFVLNSKKSAISGVDRNDVHPVQVVLPPLKEQLPIAAFLDYETTQIDALIAEQQ